MPAEHASRRQTSAFRKSSRVRAGRSARGVGSVSIHACRDAVLVRKPPTSCAGRRCRTPGSPGEGEVLLDVVASAVNRADLLQRQGHYPPPPGASEILGLECSGRIAAVGSGVTGWSVGDEVCALLAGGGYASQVLVPAGQVMPVPDGIELLTAGGLPGGGLHGATATSSRPGSWPTARRSSSTAAAAASARWRSRWCARSAPRPRSA